MTPILSAQGGCATRGLLFFLRASIGQMNTLRLIFLLAGLGFAALAATVFLAQGFPKSTTIIAPALLLGYLALGRHSSA